MLEEKNDICDHKGFYKITEPVIIQGQYSTRVVSIKFCTSCGWKEEIVIHL